MKKVSLFQSICVPLVFLDKKLSNINYIKYFDELKKVGSFKKWHYVKMHLNRESLLKNILLKHYTF